METLFRRLFRLPKREKSIFFFTLHKSASTLFGNVVLPHISNLRHIDFAAKIYSGELKKTPVFESYGYIYGPIRVWQERHNPESELLLEPCLKNDFLAAKKCLLFIRDPRDILVSFYYSVASTHGISDVPEIALLQNQRRAEAMELGLDAYCLKIAPKIRENFLTLQRVHESCKYSLLLRYEDLVQNFSPFSTQLRSFLDIHPESLQRLFDESRPLQNENLSGHKRSGAIEGFRNKLTKNTLSILNDQLRDILITFNYSH